MTDFFFFENSKPFSSYTLDNASLINSILLFLALFVSKIWQTYIIPPRNRLADSKNTKKF